MSEDQINLNEILEKLNKLLEKQKAFQEELTAMSKELEQVKRSIPFHAGESNPNQETVSEPPRTTTIDQQKKKIIEPQSDYASFAARKQAYYASQEKRKKEKSARSTEIEKFIGENLINKIGIIITIIGVAIGAKYAIDHKLISPSSRILLGYLVGIILFGFAIRLKKNYKNFSAVLMSGAMAIIYFITYAAFSFYALMPQYLAFGLMVMITIFTAYAAIQYDRQVIALIGMVGAYGIPFLLSEGPGNMVVLFTYISIINLGIMVLAFKKYWKPIYYISFVLSWLIYFAWYESSYNDVNYFFNAFLFLSVFFLIFYVTYLSYNLIRKEQFNWWDVMLILANSFIFYGIGYALLIAHPEGRGFLGLFTLITALIHVMACGLIYKMKLAEWHLFYFISALALTFLTIAVPVQLSGNWITLLWVGEAGLLFWVGRIKQISVYETISFVMMLLALISITMDWGNGYSYNRLVEAQFSVMPIANIYFMTSLLFVAVFTFINLLNRNKNYPSTIDHKSALYQIMQFLIPAILFSVLYFMFWFEINSYCNQHVASIVGTVSEGANDVLNSRHYADLIYFKIIWLLNYSLLYFVGLSLLNIRFLKSRLLGYLNLGINLMVLVLFLTMGLYSLSELRDSFLNQTSTDLYHPAAFNVIIRYVSFLFVLPLLMICHQYVRKEFMDIRLNRAYSLILHTAILWILSSELITWIDFFEGAQAYKLGLSLLWGGYALFLIVLGIWKQHQHLRIGAIVLFGVTLLKLFFFDLRDMGTISKTIVFVILGILLLIISFLYHKYKHIIYKN